MTDEAAARRPEPAPGPDPGAPATGAADAPPTAPPRAEPPPGSEPPPAGPAPGLAGFTFPARDRLIRPKQGRYVAGVCAAVGRATNTDPVLWRVVLTVLGFFGGAGVLLYLAGWLLLPEDGDTASPVEAALGRGRSSTSPTTVLVLGVLTAVAFGFIVTDGFRSALLVAALVVGGALLVRRNATHPRTRAAEAGPTGTAGPDAADEPVTAPLPFPAPGPAAPDATLPLPPVPPDPAAPGGYGPPPPIGGYRPPFAPHGPYAGPPTEGYGAPPGPVAAPPRTRRPKPPRERSKLGRATFFLILVALGGVAALSLGGVIAATPATYFGVALFIVALGLIVGAWFGRSRGLIALGLIASLGLAVSSAAGRWDGLEGTGSETWRPRTVAEVAGQYRYSVGRVQLDLREVDFTGQRVSTAVQMDAGRLEVQLPPNVDVVVRLDRDVDHARLFGADMDGRIGSSAFTDTGADGPGGGNLELDLGVELGSVEVSR